MMTFNVISIISGNYRHERDSGYKEGVIVAGWHQTIQHVIMMFTLLLLAAVCFASGKCVFVIS